jgi:hypothetical protein
LTIKEGHMDVNITHDSNRVGTKHFSCLPAHQQCKSQQTAIQWTMVGFKHH